MKTASSSFSILVVTAFLNSIFAEPIPALVSLITRGATNNIFTCDAPANALLKNCGQSAPDDFLTPASCLSNCKCHTIGEFTCQSVNWCTSKVVTDTCKDFLTGGKCSCQAEAKNETEVSQPKVFSCFAPEGGTFKCGSGGPQFGPHSWINASDCENQCLCNNGEFSHNSRVTCQPLGDCTGIEVANACEAHQGGECGCEFFMVKKSVESQSETLGRSIVKPPVRILRSKAGDDPTALSCGAPTDGTFECEDDISLISPAESNRAASATRAGL